MDCKYFVKVMPIKIIDDDFGVLVLDPYHDWLKENLITRYRGGYWSTDPNYYILNKTITFRFADKEDAMAFKLAWV